MEINQFLRLTPPILRGQTGSSTYCSTWTIPEIRAIVSSTGSCSYVSISTTISPLMIRMLKKVNGVRQVEIVELMMSTNNFTAAYAEVLVLGTPKHQLVNQEQPKKKKGLSSIEIAQMEHEMESLQQDFKTVQANYGEDTMNLTFVRGYIKKLLENAKVVRFLNTNYPDISSEFESIATAQAL